MTKPNISVCRRCAPATLTRLRARGIFRRLMPVDPPLLPSVYSVRLDALRASQLPQLLDPSPAVSMWGRWQKRGVEAQAKRAMRPSPQALARSETEHITVKPTTRPKRGRKAPLLIKAEPCKLTAKAKGQSALRYHNLKQTRSGSTKRSTVTRQYENRIQGSAGENPRKRCEVHCTKK